MVMASYSPGFTMMILLLPKADVSSAVVETVSIVDVSVPLHTGVRNEPVTPAKPTGLVSYDGRVCANKKLELLMSVASKLIRKENNKRIFSYSIKFGYKSSEIDSFSPCYFGIITWQRITFNISDGF
jgi:hypothetical protein